MYKHNFSLVTLVLIIVLVVVASPGFLSVLVGIGIIYGLLSALNAGFGWLLLACVLGLLCPPALAIYGAACAVTGGNCITD